MKVRELIRVIGNDGWRRVKTKGSHRQYKHPAKPGRVTIPGHPGDDLHPDTPKSVLKQAGLKGKAVKRYAVVIESGPNNLSAYVPDLPGCITTGKTVEEIEQNIREAIELHLEGMKEDGEPIPEPTTAVSYVELRVA